MSEQNQVKRVGCGVPVAIVVGLVVLFAVVGQVRTRAPGKPTPK